MTLQDFVERVAKNNDMPFDEAKKFVIGVLGTMRDEIDTHNELTLRGFGCYGIKIIVDLH